MTEKMEEEKDYKTDILRAISFVLKVFDENYMPGNVKFIGLFHFL